MKEGVIEKLKKIKYKKETEVKPNWLDLKRKLRLNESWGRVTKLRCFFSPEKEG